MSRLKEESIEESVRSVLAKTLSDQLDFNVHPEDRQVDEETNHLTNEQLLAHISNAIDEAFGIEPRSWRC